MEFRTMYPYMNLTHDCQVVSIDGYQITCLGAIKGKVLAVELTTDKFDKTDEPCLKIRINEWKNLRTNKKFVVYYGIETYGKRKPPEKGKTYWFFLHEVKGIDHKYSQRGWQWTHCWQLVVENSTSK